MNKILERFRSLTGWMSSSAIGVIIDLLRMLYVRIKDSDLVKVEKILVLVERACNLTLDTVFMLRRVLEDKKITAEEAEAVARMITHRIQELDELKALAGKVEA